MALLAVVVHVQPLVATAIMNHLIHHEFRLGADLMPNREWDNSANLLIQFAAKFLKIMIIGSLTTMILTFIRREVTLSQGTPLAVFFAGNNFSSSKFLWSDELTAMMRDRFLTVEKGLVRFLPHHVLRPGGDHGTCDGCRPDFPQRLVDEGEFASMETRCRVTILDSNNTDITALENPTTQAFLANLDSTSPPLPSFGIDPELPTSLSASSSLSQAKGNSQYTGA
ncbi:hypothetical protein CORC01_12345 [Colletotrichum orchidophilum]|uniref:Uncharacterized protein n=1 Tax=Colletotrichum orchidophilum TaxID=1209926 RepID=A0A1G4AT54_9PEZI|nr:uncharacterized protein CORC01_12345 [Colletotrichum orchidophilum]OHE92350.1 hypothetical protein CORC01_12345 [Colletotrichum orchidophilum]